MSLNSADTMPLIQSSDARIDADKLVNKSDNSHNAGQYVARGHRLSQAGRFVEAESCYRKAIELSPDYPMAHNNLGWIRQMQGDSEEAVASYRRALHFDQNLRIARRNLALLLVQLGRHSESSYLFYEEMLASGSEGANWMIGLVTEAMQARDLRLAGEYAAILAGLRWGSTLYPPRRDGSLPPLPVQAPDVFLTISKLRHDIEQFLYLQSKGVLGNELTSIIKDYQDIIDRLTARGINGRVPLDDEAQRTIGHVYNRILHVRRTPRV